jgi:ribosomal-protein-alanine N-acetyltransferase
MSNQILTTDRLRLEPLTLERIDAALNDRDRLAGLVRARVSEEWPNDDFLRALPVIRTDVETNPEFGYWSRLLVHGDLVIGDAGFKSLPLRGRVEIGYGIIPAMQGRGFATEAASALVAWAFTRAGVTRIVAESLESNTASIRVLKKVGFRRTGRVHTGEGPMLKWAINRPELDRAISRRPG